MAAKKKRTTPKKKATGKRYTDAKKAQIIAFVNEVNAAKGRGGVTASAKKYGVSPLSISNWIKKGGAASSPKKAKGARKATTNGRKRNKSESAWDELVRLRNDISSLEKELEQKRDRFNKVKTKI
jgi:transposase-like protein